MNKTIDEKAVPTAYVTTNKSRLKLYDITDIESDGPIKVNYLNDKQEFEIELFNPTQKTIAASIAFNGQSESTQKIVINPGQRIFLERYFDTNKKFKFDTYEVAAGDKQVDKAIIKNGLVEIKFYEEYIPFNFDYNKTVWNGSWGNNQNYGYPNNWNNANTIIGGPHITTGNTFYCQTSDVNFVGGTITTTEGSGTITMNAANFANASFTNTGGVSGISGSVGEQGQPGIPETKETGRVEQGSHSNQKFSNSAKSFSYYAFETVKFRILPASRRNFTKEDVKAYCTGCGVRQRKDNWKFCPKCGTKFE